MYVYNIMHTTLSTESLHVRAVVTFQSNIIYRIVLPTPCTAVVGRWYTRAYGINQSCNYLCITRLLGIVRHGARALNHSRIWRRKDICFNFVLFYKLVYIIFVSPILVRTYTRPHPTCLYPINVFFLSNPLYVYILYALHYIIDSTSTRAPRILLRNGALGNNVLSKYFCSYARFSVYHITV